MNITNEFGGLTKITFESFEKSLFHKIADNAKRKLKPKDRTIDSRSMTITVNQYVAREFLDTTRAIRDVGQESFVGKLDKPTEVDTVVDGKVSKPKKDDKRSAPPLPEGEFYGPYETSPYLHIKCDTCSRWLSTDDAVKRHIGLGCRIRDYKQGGRDVV